MNKSEVAVQVYVEKIKLEHQALLQELNVLLVSLVGLPVAWITGVNILGLIKEISHPVSIIVLGSIIGTLVFLIDRKNDQLYDKRDEMDGLLKTLSF